MSNGPDMRDNRAHVIGRNHAHCTDCRGCGGGGAGWLLGGHRARGRRRVGQLQAADQLSGRLSLRDGAGRALPGGPGLLPGGGRTRRQRAHRPGAGRGAVLRRRDGARGDRHHRCAQLQRLYRHVGQEYLEYRRAARHARSGRVRSAVLRGLYAGDPAPTEEVSGACPTARLSRRRGGAG
ncbi:Uncharacterised protein [Bordetella pertussis]|nr:Uncharacterised protein [Bordetella pertussis]